VDSTPLVVAVAEALAWDRFTLIGHSMGAGIASLVPAVAPERVERLVLLEGIGPLADDPLESPQGLADAIRDERRLANTEPRRFPDLEAAVEARRRGSDLDPDAARLLVERGTEATAEGLRFTFDPRLRTRSLLRMTEEQVLAFLAAIRCPVLAVRAKQGWPVPEDTVAGRFAAVPSLVHVEVEGGHHVHLTHPERVAPVVLDFLRTSP
jgi:pimeloyl-ACP methyl ester carboxylesterase